jgi:hypothetical protein
MSRLLLKGIEATVPNTVGAGSSFSEATVVRLANPSATNYVITVSETNTGPTIGTFTLLANSSELLEKYPTHTVHVSAGTDVLGTKVGFTG